MNAKDIRNLQEAYLQIYEEKSIEPDPFGRPGGKHGGFKPGGGYDRGYQAMVKKIKQLEAKNKKPETNEQVELYDIILSHLLDEGYADTVESAEVIMENMSEEWKDTVKSAVKGGAYGTGYVAGKTVNVASSAAKKFGKTSLGKRIKRFVNYTALGALANPILS